MEIWEDYYNILQVHYDAEQEIIQSSYKRLCKKYHPDVNKEPGAAEKIKRINIAYETLGDERKRRIYHLEWKRRQNTGTQRPVTPIYRYQPPKTSAAPPPPPPPPPEPGTKEAKAAVEEYFLHISQCDFKNAYKSISETDKNKISFSNFTEWQESVAAIYTIGSFSIKLFKTLDDIKIGPLKKYKAEEYTVSVTEKNKNTNKVTEYSFTKIAILEDKQWKIYLGYRDLNPIVQKFKYMANSQDEAQMTGYWEHYNETNDSATGLPNLKGFLELSEPELYRLKRYGRQFTIGVFQFALPDKMKITGQYERQLKNIGHILKKSLRMTDIAGYIGDDRFAVLFAETDKANAGLASKRIMKIIKREIGVCFDIDLNVKLGIYEQNSDNISKSIDACVNIIKNAGDLSHRAPAGKVGSR